MEATVWPWNTCKNWGTHREGNPERPLGPAPGATSAPLDFQLHCYKSLLASLPTFLSHSSNLKPKNIFTCKSNCVTFLLNPERLPRALKYTSHLSISVCAPWMCQGYPASSSCLQEVALSLLFSLLWTLSVSHTVWRFSEQLLLSLYTYLPHSMPLKAKCPSHSSWNPDIGALVTVDSNLLIFPVNTPVPNSLNSKWYANFSTTGPGTYQMTNKYVLVERS